MPPYSDPLEILGIAPAGARIMRYFLVRPRARVHLRGLQRTLGLGGASVQRELERLIQLGALERIEEGGRPVYRPVQDAPWWQALRVMEAGSRDPAPLVADALVDVPGIRAAFLYGSTARGQQAAESDVDLMVLQDDEVDRRALLGHLSEVGVILGKEINPVRYTLRELGERLGDPSHPARAFVREVLSGPKRWVAGSPEAVAPVAAAAGIRMEEGEGA